MDEVVIGQLQGEARRLDSGRAAFAADDLHSLLPLPWLAAEVLFCCVRPNDGGIKFHSQGKDIPLRCNCPRLFVDEKWMFI